MAELHKRWNNERRVDRAYGGNIAIYRWFLGGTVNTQDWERVHMACIESYDASNGPFKLEIWDFANEDWDLAGEFPTLKQAKVMGRLMAGLSLTRSA